MSDRDRSRMVWVVLLLLFLFCMIIASHGREVPRGAERQRHEAKISYYKQLPLPDAPFLDPDTSKTSNTITVVLAWDASPSTNVIARYEMGQGPATQTYTNITSSGLNLTLTVGGLDRYGRYYFAVRAVANQSTNAVSEWSNEVYLNGRPRTNNVLTLWTSLTNWLAVTLTNPVPNFFYRTKTTKLSANRYRTVAQRAPMITGLWEDWTNYWAPITNSIAVTNIHLYITTQRE